MELSPSPLQGSNGGVYVSLQDEVLCEMIQSVLQWYEHILTNTERQILNAILSLDVDARRLLFSM